MMSKGYTGKILKINLTTGKSTIETHDSAFYRRYFGGRALASYYLLTEMDPNIDPFAPENCWSEETWGIFVPTGCVYEIASGEVG